MEFKDSDHCYGCSQTNTCGLKFKIVQTYNTENSI